MKYGEPVFDILYLILAFRFSGEGEQAHKPLGLGTGSPPHSPLLFPAKRLAAECIGYELGHCPQCPLCGPGRADDSPVFPQEGRGKTVSSGVDTDSPVIFVLYSGGCGGRSSACAGHADAAQNHLLYLAAGHFPAQRSGKCAKGPVPLVQKGRMR